MGEAIQVTRSMFEGLFVRALEPRGEFLAELKSAGFDPTAIQAQYPISTWWKCVDIAAKHHCAGMGRDEADRALGAIFANGFLNTLPGSATAGGLAVMGPERMVERVPYLCQLVRTDLDVHVEKSGASEALVHVVDAYPRPHFMSGCIQLALERTKTKGSVTVETLTPTGYVIKVAW
ncbi:MAG: DUF2378 family protein [Myxococcaceae bacterium]